MRISFQMLAMLLTCFLGGLIVYVAVGINYQALAVLQTRYNNSAMLMRDARYMETSMSQWLVNLELFFSRQEGYLARGIQTQAGQLQQMVRLFQSDPAGAAAEHDRFVVLSDQIADLTDIVSRASTLERSDGEQWNLALLRSEELSFNIVEGVEHLLDKVANTARKSETRLIKAQQQLYQLIMICLVIYIAVCVAVWRWATVILVKPLETLTALASDSNHAQTQRHFELNAGPTEVRQLSASFADLANRLGEQKQRAVDAKPHNN